jgi:multidrug efflux system outer membrane protein
MPGMPHNSGIWPRMKGRNFLVSNLIAEIANSYYELMALDNLLVIINSNAAIQEEALRKVKIQKQSSKANQLAVNRFEAQLLKTQNLQYDIRQQIVETENRINFLVGHYPSAIDRNTEGFMDLQIGQYSGRNSSSFVAKQTRYSPGGICCKPLIWM